MIETDTRLVVISTLLTPAYGIFKIINPDLHSPFMYSSLIAGWYGNIYKFGNIYKSQ